MKRVVFMIIPALICGAVFTSCGSDKAEPKKENLQYVKTELGGCNIKSDLKSDSDETETKDDEVIITISEDFVHVFVGLNYTCKELPFETKCETVDDVLCMYINDSGGEYYRCECYYTFDFEFKYHVELNQKYKILLIDRSGNQVVISEGTIVGNDEI